MRVLYCTSESNPFAGSGGLADVAGAGSLPKALKEKGVDCRVVMPLYGDIPYGLKQQMRYITNFTVPVGWRSQYCGVFECYYNDIVYYFIDNEYYFKRSGLYGFYDDAERFAFFSRAIMEMLPRVNFHPDILQCNDWQTALVPTYYYMFYCHNPWYHNIKSVFTIHNIQYQGMYGWEVNTECVGVPADRTKLLEQDGKLNFVKGAIETSTRVTTVSPSYANEILNPWFSHGLDTILRRRQYKLCGILNGIDNASYNPENDIQLYAHYSANDLRGKAFCKSALQERLNLERRSDPPIIAMVTRLVGHKGLDLVRLSLDEIMCDHDVQFVILGSGDKEYEDFFAYMQRKYPGRFCFCHGYIPELARKIYSGSDIFLMPSKSEPCGLSQMIALRYGSIPVVRETGGLRDSIHDSMDGYGNGFTFAKYEAYDMVQALKRAINGYWNKDGWSQLVKRAMWSDNSWARSAQDYLNVYNDTVNNWN